MKPLLIVDDEAAIVTMLSQYFQSHGYKTFTAGDGIEALAVAKNEALGAVFLDLKMPDMDGAEAMRLIHEIDETLPIIIVSGMATEDEARQLLRAGAFDYVNKPVQPARLGELVAQLEELEQVRAPEPPEDG